MRLDAEQLRSREFQRILLIKLSAVGDVIHTIPVLNKLRRRFPSARIDWLVTPGIAELLRHHPSISNVLLFDREQWSAPWSIFRSLARLGSELKSRNYDLVIDMHGQFRTAALTLATAAPVRIGFPRPRTRIWAASNRTLPAQARKHAWKGAREGAWIAYTHFIPLPTLDRHAVDRYLGVGPMLGLDDEPGDFAFPIPPAASERIDSFIRQHEPAGCTRLLTIAPGTVWETKHWRSEGFAEVARHFLRKGFAVVLTGSKRERAACAEVASAAPGILNLAGETTLSEHAALIGRSTLCVTNDSGPMHVAVALGRPVVSIFGPTDEIWIGPYRRANAVVRASLPCAPCYLRVLSRCPHDHACMREVSAQAVIERAEMVLAMQGAESRAIAHS
ncbi:MAG TPA: glycosyltransferase family 9 protein [Xanthobacteraceae bacterium]